MKTWRGPLISLYTEPPERLSTALNPKSGEALGLEERPSV